MLRKLLTAGNSNRQSATRRRYPRRTCDKCIGIVNGRIYPVHDWCPGGALIEGDERIFSVGDKVDVTLKFSVEGNIISLDHKGDIIRKGEGKIALQFMPLTEAMWQGFRKVIDHHTASEFASSQMA